MTGKDDGKRFAVISTVSADRPGIVADVTGWVDRFGGNIEDSRMACLAGEFATIILVSGDEKLAEQLEAAAGDFGREKGLQVFVKPAGGPTPPADQPFVRYILRATALDHPGIVHRVSGLLSRENVNIVSARTQTVSAPFSGSPVFQIRMKIDIPARIAMGDLRDKLRDLGDEEGIDFLLTPDE